MFVLYPINVKTTEPIGPKFFEGPSLKGEGLWNHSQTSFRAKLRYSAFALFCIMRNIAEQILSKRLNKCVNVRAKFIALHAQNICAKITQILRKKYGNFMETLDGRKAP